MIRSVERISRCDLQGIFTFADHATQLHKTTYINVTEPRFFDRVPPRPAFETGTPQGRRDVSAQNTRSDSDPSPEPASRETRSVPSRSVDARILARGRNSYTRTFRLGGRGHWKTFPALRTLRGVHAYLGNPRSKSCHRTPRFAFSTNVARRTCGNVDDPGKLTVSCRSDVMIDELKEQASHLKAKTDQLRRSL
ncbi:hypothetical protein Pan216_14460 [Planctomycetes bacterium Pan216]|uniref:Uncharacterized protein n=1 Tax=Kolteria novifilia TaxID=2527975 RepID=A0A518B0T6_9BACT|nr:hypothetical protein Pan216_14460 [Planctomycetes bacterium Pan216]